jgi:hypothetical protein
VFQFGELLTIEDHFTRWHLCDTYLWRWWYDNTARRERDGVNPFGCLPQQVHANSGSAGSIGYVIQNLGDVKPSLPLSFGARVAVQRPASLL